MEEELEEELNQESKLKLDDEGLTKLFRLQAGDEMQELVGDGSMVSQSFRPSIRRTQKSKVGSGGDWEENSVVMFLQTLLLIC